MSVIVKSFPFHKSPSFSLFGEDHLANKWAAAYAKGNYETVFTRWLKKQEFDYFFDVGAAFGYYSILAAELGARHVWSFEASPTRWGFLKYNTDCYPNIHAPYGFIETASKPQTPQQMSAANLKQGEFQKPEKLDLKEFLMLAGDERAIVKMDVEGNEVAILESVASYILKDNFVWMIEVHEKRCDASRVYKLFEGMKETPLHGLSPCRVRKVVWDHGGVA